MIVLLYSTYPCMVSFVWLVGNSFLLFIFWWYIGKSFLLSRLFIGTILKLITTLHPRHYRFFFLLIAGDYNVGFVLPIYLLRIFFLFLGIYWLHPFQRQFWWDLLDRTMILLFLSWSFYADCNHWWPWFMLLHLWAWSSCSRLLEEWIGAPHSFQPWFQLLCLLDSLPLIHDLMVANDIQQCIIQVKRLAFVLVLQPLRISWSEKKHHSFFFMELASNVFLCAKIYQTPNIIPNISHNRSCILTFSARMNCSWSYSP